MPTDGFTCQMEATDRTKELVNFLAKAGHGDPGAESLLAVLSPMDSNLAGHSTTVSFRIRSTCDGRFNLDVISMDDTQAS